MVLAHGAKVYTTGLNQSFHPQDSKELYASSNILQQRHCDIHSCRDIVQGTTVGGPSVGPRDFGDMSCNFSGASLENRILAMPSSDMFCPGSQ